MKAFIRVYIDGYEGYLNTLKNDEVRSILVCIHEFIQKESISTFTVELSRYNEPVALNIPADFMKNYDKKRIDLNPYGFHKKLSIQFDSINNMNLVCNCGDIWCEFDCGTLPCGCIDVCRRRCITAY